MGRFLGLGSFFLHNIPVGALAGNQRRRWLHWTRGCDIKAWHIPTSLGHTGFSRLALQPLYSYEHNAYIHNTFFHSMLSSRWVEVLSGSFSGSCL